MNILDTLNEQQKQAVEQVEGPMLILAGAGSGKTKTVTHKIAYMINNKKIKPNNILALTFTNKAAKEMKERALKLISTNYKNEISISTFHSFALKVLKIYATELGYTNNFTLYDVEDQKKLLSTIIKKNDYSTLNNVKDLMSKISKFKENFKEPEIVAKEIDINYSNNKELYKCYVEYQDNLKSNNAMDFSDLLLNTYKILLNDKIIEKFQNQYKYIIIDEYQDTNNIQYKIVNKIAQKYKNICVVGDEDQSIYKFRGADITNILNFENDYPNTKVIKLEKNYRSTKNILDVANAVIKNNTTSKGKKLWTDLGEGDKVEIYRSPNIYEEAKYVVNKIISLKNNNKLNFSDFTILYRINSQSRSLEESLINNRIPHKIFGGFQFYQRKEIKTIHSYLNLLNNKDDNINFLNIINIPRRGIGVKTIENIIENATLKNLSYYESICDMEFKGKVKNEVDKFIKIYDDIYKDKDKLNILEIIKKVVIGFELEDSYENDNKKERMENIEELYSAVLEFMENTQDPTLNNYISSISLYTNTDDITDEDYVKLMTVHSSKGLEFNNVFIVGMEDGLFPLYRDRHITDEDLEEERRLCYVAITRAKKNLYITYSAKKKSYIDDYRFTKMSRFIEEMPGENILYLNQQKEKKLETNEKLNATNNIENFNPFKKKVKKSFSFKVGDRVMHSKFGEGKVIHVDDKITMIQFMYEIKKISTILSEKVLKKV